MKIYTKTGDSGTTSLMSGCRVEKDDIRIEVNGEIDELTSALGLAVSFAEDEAAGEMLRHVQRQLMSVMAIVASDASKPMVPQERLEALSEDVGQMEKQIDEWSKEGPFSFVLPGGNHLQAALHVARAKARTCERRLWTMQRSWPVDGRVLMYVNRLSDWLFAMAISM